MGPPPAPATPSSALCLPPTCSHSQQDPRSWTQGQQAWCGLPAVGPGPPRPPGLTDESDRPRHGQPRLHGSHSSDATVPEETRPPTARAASGSDGNYISTNPQRDPNTRWPTAAAGKSEPPLSPRRQGRGECAARLLSPSPAHALRLREASARRRPQGASRFGSCGPAAGTTASSQGPSLRSSQRWARGHCSSMAPPVKTLRDLGGGAPGTSPRRTTASPSAPRTMPATSGSSHPLAEPAEAAHSSPCSHSVKTFAN